MHITLSRAHVFEDENGFKIIQSIAFDSQRALTIELFRPLATSKRRLLWERENKDDKTAVQPKKDDDCM